MGNYNNYFFEKEMADLRLEELETTIFNAMRGIGIKHNITVEQLVGILYNYQFDDQDNGGWGV